MGGHWFHFSMAHRGARWTGHARPAIAWNTVRTSRNEKTGGRPASTPSEVGDGRNTRPCLPPARTWKLEGAGICGVPSRGKVSHSWSGASVSVSALRRRRCQCPVVVCRPWRDILSEPGLPNVRRRASRDCLSPVRVAVGMVMLLHRVSASGPEGGLQEDLQSESQWPVFNLTIYRVLTQSATISEARQCSRLRAKSPYANRIHATGSNPASTTPRSKPSALEPDQRRSGGPGRLFARPDWFPLRRCLPAIGVRSYSLGQLCRLLQVGFLQAVDMALQCRSKL